MQISSTIYFDRFLIDIWFSQAYMNGAKDKLSTVMVTEEGEQTTLFCTWPKSEHHKIRPSAILTTQKSDMNHSVIQ